MKTKGIFRILATPFLALAALFSAPVSTYSGGRSAYGMGRDAFRNVSAGRQHNVKTRHPL